MKAYAEIWFAILVLVIVAAYGVAITACDSSSPTAPATVIVQASVRAVGMAIFYEDESEPSDKYARIDWELIKNLGGSAEVFVKSGSEEVHGDFAVEVTRTGIGDYEFRSTAVSKGGDQVGFGTFPITVTGL